MSSYAFALFLQQLSIHNWMAKGSKSIKCWRKFFEFLPQDNKMIGLTFFPLLSLPTITRFTQPQDYLRFMPLTGTIQPYLSQHLLLLLSKEVRIEFNNYKRFMKK